MPSFTFRVGTQDGQILERKVESMSFDAAREELRQQGLHIFSGKRSGLKLGDLLPRSRRIISTEKFLLFNQEL
ncbi:MAG: type II secretion system F family protein, partial [Acidobacteria bacterium]|nr:type II secretion system F family protein [Acidobacteriota bacterium]